MLTQRAVNMYNPFEKAGAEAALINGAAVNMKKVEHQLLLLDSVSSIFLFPSSTYIHNVYYT